MNRQDVLLAPLRTSDSETLFGWINNRDLVIQSNNYAPVHEPCHRRWFDIVTSSKDTRIFSIRTSQGDVLIGSCQLNHIDLINRSAELQIRIGEQRWRGRGYGGQAIAQLIAYGFNDLGLNRVYLNVYANNTAAINLYRRLGFVHEAVFRQAAYLDSKYVDVIGMAMVRELWNG